MEASKTHVENFDLIRIVYEQICGFYVAMNHSSFVRVLKSAGRLMHVLRRALLTHGAFFFDDFFEILPLDEFHNNIVTIPLFIDAVCVYDIRMIEGGDGASLIEEPFLRLRVGHQFARDDFQSHRTIHRNVFGPKHAAHSSCAQQIHEFVLSEEKRGISRQKLAGLPERDFLLPKQLFEKILAFRVRLA